jgi:hypothetical protein
VLGSLVLYVSFQILQLLGLAPLFLELVLVDEAKVFLSNVSQMIDRLHSGIGGGSR